MNTLQILSTTLLIFSFLIYFYQLVYLFLPLFRKIRHSGNQKPLRYAVLIAARNEEAVLPHLLDSIHAQDYPSDLITTYVIADNCTDSTAAVAAAHGARVCQRFNTAQVGKGYALNYLLEHIRLTGEVDDFDAFLIFDADNLLAPDYISKINQLPSDGFEAFCGYRNSKNFGDSWVSAGSAIWYLHESTHMNQSRMIRGTSCSVSGTGFGFTRSLLERMDGWNFFTLTEDIEFRTWCATRGIPIGYCHDAVLYDEQPATLSLSVRQRTRWVQGGIQVSLKYRKDYLRGMGQRNGCGWASFEFATQSLWGYSFSAASWLLRVLAVFTATGWLGLAKAMMLTVLFSYASLCLSGAMTVAAEKDRIRASRREILIGLLTYPIFMAAYVPIAISSVFQPREWKPIDHTVAVSLDQMNCK